MSIDPDALDIDEHWMLRESARLPGYYLNKMHWNSLLLDERGELPDEIIAELFAESYRLVFESLPRRVQNEIA